MRHRFFGQDPRYIALKELNGEGKYLRDRTSLDSIAAPDDDDSETYTPTLRKRMSYAFTRRPSFSRRPSRLSLTSSTQWKRVSLSRAVTATRDAFGAIPRRRRNSQPDDEPAPTVEDVDRKRQSWIQSWMNTSAPDLNCKFTLPHSTLFVPV
ncbi:hypothetical protein LLEC1_03331 [Akanthomyces lecanii]|uniref:Uncharacterized protein n=1 Tax=Cordyceps confragosa TaxID=2714763 RepID=A0A179IDR9_CORDF|nr:hypothetical protein LLEC1_03331 [Akanthomyces lecanii]